MISNQKSSQTTQNNSKKTKKEKGYKDASDVTNQTNNNYGGRDSDRGRCPIQGHDKMRHDWRGCHLDPYSQRYDPKAGQAFFENKANSPDVWYRDVFKNASGQSYAFSVGQGGGSRGGSDFQGRGFGRRRGCSRDRGGYQGRVGYQGRGRRGYNGGGQGLYYQGNQGSYYQGNTDSCNQGGGGWSNNGWSNNASYPPLAQPESQNAQSFHNVPCPAP